MPEGPEVATIVEALNSTVRGHRIIQIEAISSQRQKQSPTNVSPWSDRFDEKSVSRVTKLVGAQIVAVRRVGKNIVFDLDNGLHLVVHLLMTGQLLYGEDIPSPHLRWCLRLDNGRRLCLADKRRWVRGRILTEDEIATDPPLNSLGMDVLSEAFTPDGLYKVLYSTRRAIHTVLLDQKRISGLGNIYVNEALFCAAIDPRMPAKQVPRDKALALFWAIYYIVREARRHHGTTFSDYRTPDGKRGSYQQCLRVFQRKGKPCVHCGTPLTNLKIGGRGVYLCPHDQLGEPSRYHWRPVHDTKGQWQPTVYPLPEEYGEEEARAIARHIPFTAFAASPQEAKEALAGGDDVILPHTLTSALSAAFPIVPLPPAADWEEAMRLIYQFRCRCS